MIEFIRAFPKQLLKGVEVAAHLPENNQAITHVIIAGMGGSALPGDILQNYLAGKVRIDISRDYEIPTHWLTDNSLVIVSSFSGNTEETIASLEGIREHAKHLVVITHGGTLARLAEEYALPLVTLPDAIQPRNATGFFLGAMLETLHKYGAVTDPRKEMEGTQALLEQEQDALEQYAHNLAKELKGHVPIIYAGEPMRSVARIMKINFNETSKTQSFWNVLPEMNHNEMVGFTNLILQPHILFLRSSLNHERVELRMDVLESIMKEKDVAVTNVILPDSSMWTQLMYGLFLGYFASYYLAGEYDVDPAPVQMVEDFKKMLVS